MAGFLSSCLILLILFAVLIWTLKQYFIVRLYASRLPKQKKKRRKRIVYDDDLND